MNPKRELLERCCGDDRRAHSELYRECFPFLVSICRRYYINREDMESSLNQIYVKMIRHMNKFLNKPADVPFALWVRRIAINHVIDEFRKNNNHREKIDYREINDGDEIHPSFDPASGKESLEEIHGAIAKLSNMNRAVFNLFVIDGYGHDEIGQMLKISSGTSKAHLHNARKRLKDLLSSDKKKVVIDNSVLL